MIQLPLKGIIIAAGLLFLWHMITMITNVPPFMLPPPVEVLKALLQHRVLLLHHTWITFLEMLLGLLIGVSFGGLTALLLILLPRIHLWLMPVLVISQALPVFAIAPLLVLWLGYGLSSKVAMASLIIFFPVTVTLYNGLSNIPQAWRDQVTLMNQGRRYITFNSLRHLLIPAALPTIAAGLRVAASVVPIGAVVGEWVGSSGGLGYLMLQSNAKVQTELMFAALFVLASMGLLLYSGIDHWMNHLTRYHKKS